MVRLLSKQQVDMRCSNEDGTTHIHAAAMNGHLEVVRRATRAVWMLKCRVFNKWKFEAITGL